MDRADVSKGPRILVVSPFHNEAAFVSRVCDAMACQTVPPTKWIAVDDGSTDGTHEALRRASVDVPQMTVLRREATRTTCEIRDPLATGAAVRSTNWGLQHTTPAEFDLIAKIDGDIVLPPTFFGDIVEQFRSDGTLGICGGRLLEETGGGLKTIPIPSHHVHGALKVYSRTCFDAIGGLEPRLAWDTIDETYARLLGFRTSSPTTIVALHLRPWGSADGVLRGRARHGTCAYITHYPPYWIILRSAKLSVARPWVISGAAFAFGYFRARVQKTPQVSDVEFRRFVRTELRGRILAAVNSKLPLVSRRVTPHR